MSYTKMRVVIPNSVTEILLLAEKIYNKHLSEGNSSPLNAVSANNWTEEGPKITKCQQKHEEAEQYKIKMEEAYKERDYYLSGINNAVRATSVVLSGVHHDNMGQLTTWGFTVIRAQKSGPKKVV